MADANILSWCVCSKCAGFAGCSTAYQETLITSPIKDGEATQFAMASQFGSVGLLAHNILSGKFFSELTIGQEVRLVYGDGKVEYFIVAEICAFRHWNLKASSSSFRNLDRN